MQGLITMQMSCVLAQCTRGSEANYGGTKRLSPRSASGQQPHPSTLQQKEHRNARRGRMGKAIMYVWHFTATMHGTPNRIKHQCLCPRTCSTKETLQLFRLDDTSCSSYVPGHHLSQNLVPTGCYIHDTTNIINL
jgi:hypothetical protein